MRIKMGKFPSYNPPKKVFQRVQNPAWESAVEFGRNMRNKQSVNLEKRRKRK